MKIARCRVDRLAAFQYLLRLALAPLVQGDEVQRAMPVFAVVLIDELPDQSLYFLRVSNGLSGHSRMNLAVRNSDPVSALSLLMHERPNEGITFEIKPRPFRDVRWSDV